MTPDQVRALQASEQQEVNSGIVAWLRSIEWLPACATWRVPAYLLACVQADGGQADAVLCAALLPHAAACITVHRRADKSHWPCARAGGAAPHPAAPHEGRCGDTAREGGGGWTAELLVSWLFAWKGCVYCD